ncbi:hypothetical protein D1007_38845 [Hordeum vulgare]|nr:hypothetical protein D1007_38845 [Hordeum vulgare]
MEIAPRKPWIWPIPKVTRQPLSLSDFFNPDCWIKCTKSKRKATSDVRPSGSALIAASTRDSRDTFLNSVVAAAGPGVIPNSTDSQGTKAGYMAEEYFPVQPDSELDSNSTGYMAQDISGRVVSIETATLGGASSSKHLARHHPCLLPPEARVRRLVTGFPRLGPGRALRVPPHTGPVALMAGRGSKQPAMQRQSGQQLGLGNPPVAKAAATAPALAGKSHANAHAGKPLTAAAGQAKENTQDNRTQHRGRWGDDGFPGLGDGQNRGGSSSRGGRGYAWHNNAAAGNDFHAPPGQFVPGPSGPSNPKRGGYQQHWIGRGGGRKPRPPVLSPEQPADLNDSTVVPMTETVQEGADSSLPDQNLVSAKGDGVERPSKWARKKDKMVCFRCSETGHFVSKAELCVYCLKPTHDTAKCPLTIGSLPVVTIYGVSSQDLMFFESPAATATIHAPDAGFTGMVTVTRGVLTVEQIVQQLKELVSSTFRWEPVLIADNVFKVVFPTKEDLARLLKFGMCRVASTSIVLEFDAWKCEEPKGRPLPLDLGAFCRSSIQSNQ